MTDRLESLLKFHPFTRLNALLDGIAPGGPALAFSVGEPQAAPPPFLAEILERHKAEWSRYPQTAGTPDFRAAVAEWLTRRYNLAEDFLDRDREIMPCAGTREPLRWPLQPGVHKFQARIPGRPESSGVVTVTVE